MKKLPEIVVLRQTSVRFWGQVDYSVPGGCWIWTGNTIPDGYGRLFALGGQRLAHRLAFFFHHGRWPDPQCLHRCDNPPCVNPDHLFEGTVSDNMTDCVRKGRRNFRGEKNPNSKLTIDDVRAIRSRAETGETQYSLAAEYGVTAVTVSQIVLRKHWKHV